jgi:predicted nucleotidyltransferase
VNEIADNLAAIQIIAAALKGDLERIGFVGGSTIQIYVEEQYQADMRPTTDVDFVFGAANSAEFQEFEVGLLQKGFKPATGRKDPKCRYNIQGIPVDVMPAIQIDGYITNRWYAEGMEHAESYNLPNGTKIRIFTAPYLLASKIEAHKSRGSKRGPFDEKDKDLEDVIMLIDGRPALVD